jgi:hypothetical protein
MTYGTGSGAPASIAGSSWRQPATCTSTTRGRSLSCGRSTKLQPRFGGSCNSEKRDRAPSDFYSLAKLQELSKITGIQLEDLRQPHPNEEALSFILGKLDWFFDEFLVREEMTKERDGKVAGELVVKALQKVIARSQNHQAIELQAEYERRRALTS